jgi:hypothetical protein
VGYKSRVCNVTSQIVGSHVGTCLEQTFVWSLSEHRFLFSLFKALLQPHINSNKIALLVRPTELVDVWNIFTLTERFPLNFSLENLTKLNERIIVSFGTEYFNCHLKQRPAYICAYI